MFQMVSYKISVIIPVYNVEKYIREAFDSLLAQTIGFENLQVVFADDASTDGSGAIIDEYADRYSNVTALHLPENSGGCGAPRNKAMELAEAEYMMFLDPDDTYYPNTCEILYNAIMESGADSIGGYHSDADESGGITLERSALFNNAKSEIFSLPDELNELIPVNTYFWSKIYRTSIIRENNVLFPAGIPGEDTVFILHYFLVCKNYEYIDKPVYIYRRRSTSISFRRDKKFFFGMNESRRQCVALFECFGHAGGVAAVLSDAVGDFPLRLLDAEGVRDDFTLDVLNEYRWMWEYCSQNNVPIRSEYARIMSEAVLSGNTTQILTEWKALRLIRQYTLELEKGNVWLKTQVTNRDGVIGELRGWIGELEKGKAWLEEQVANRDATIGELRGWIGELEKGKTWLEEQVTNLENGVTKRDVEIHRLAHRVKQFEKWLLIPLWRKLFRLK